MSGQCLVVLGEVVEGTNRLFRDDQKMHGGLWGDVVEGQNLVILVNDLGRYFSVDDLGEQSIHSCFSMLMGRAECTEGDVLAPSLLR
ncbi:hypothetical protein D3C71_1833780 [compost metagenome]